MWSFFKRIFKTKTGKAATAIILGSAAGAVSGEVSAGTAATTAVIGVMGILLRDKEAKKEAEDRGDE